MEKEMHEEKFNIPKHVAIIMDGNGRWAKKRNMPRTYGHAQGSKKVEQILKDAYDIGISYITVYAFSTENWKRSADEVSALMKIFRKYLLDCIDRATENNMQVRVIGDQNGLPADIVDKIKELEVVTKNMTGLKFNVAINYGGRDEIKRSLIELGEQIKEGQIQPEDITEDMICRHLDTAGIPDPELLIRTGGEKRLSNFLLWQMIYTEFYFTDTLWPDFDKQELMKAISYYNGRERRFGGVL